MRSVVGSNI